MIQCKDCEFYKVTPSGKRIFLCNPFENIKEPQCLVKWQLMKLDALVSIQEDQRRSNMRIAPIQDKLIKYVEREIDEMDETEGWKYGPDDLTDDFDDNLDFDCNIDDDDEIEDMPF